MVYPSDKTFFLILFIENLRNDLESCKHEIGKIRGLQTKLSDAEIAIIEYKERIEELENKTESQGLKINELERMLDEKIIESEMNRMKTDKNLKNDDAEKLSTYNSLFFYL